MNTLRISLDAVTIDGLTLHQSILLILGCLVFLAVILFILVKISQGQKMPKQVFLLVLISILMIAFPGVNKISFMGFSVELQKEIDRLKDDPSNPEARDNLIEMVSNSDESVIYSPKNLTRMAEARNMLGDYPAAIRDAEKALQKSPGYAPAQNVRAIAETGQAINVLEQNPNDPRAIMVLEQNARVLERLPVQDKYTELRIAEANLLTGETMKARERAATVLYTNPDDAKAAEIIQLTETAENIQRVRENPADTMARLMVQEDIRNLDTQPTRSATKSILSDRARNSLKMVDP
ncbi:hypothetical protein [Gaoshiqia sp. Z1-71]|uniref:hypothetical protein n=1 Tax=Gaoshiqia hydrogeniformans TaxID=3290090 RepID=UPI003BF7BAFD